MWRFSSSRILHHLATLSTRQEAAVPGPVQTAAPSWAEWRDLEASLDFVINIPCTFRNTSVAAEAYLRSVIEL